jgi:maltooligosyltrehalose trehalohydrolase
VIQRTCRCGHLPAILLTIGSSVPLNVEQNQEQELELMRPLRAQGAEVLPDGGVRYRTWCEHRQVDVLILAPDNLVARTLPLQSDGDGYFSVIDEEGKAGDRYRYRFDGTGDGWPDPAARFAPAGVHGPGMVIDPSSFVWSDWSWKPPSPRDLVIYELHVGTFTPGGTFRDVIEKLDHITELGANAIELMPVADFPGERNWGYDGVLLYAPARCYGTPDDLRALVDAAHARELAVILDVVYNHLGPDGNYLGLYNKRYYSAARQTPWGAGFMLEFEQVRDFFVENPPYWMREFHIDGFRLDATHHIQDSCDPHLLAEIATRVHELGGFVMAEDERNEPALIRPAEAGGMGLDACWADDFHHVVRVALTGEDRAYFQNFAGTPDELASTLQHGWLFTGQLKPETGEKRGGETGDLQPHQFVYCISNHDQVGNRAFGDRLHQSVSAPAYRAASALLCLVPYTPLLFMGQEWATSSPFRFFTHHNDELGARVTTGRRREFKDFLSSGDSPQGQDIPDPQEDATFLASKLNWEERDSPGHAAVLELYRACLALRPRLPRARRSDYRIERHRSGIVLLRYVTAEPEILIAVDLTGTGTEPAQIFGKDHRLILSSNERRFGGDDEEPFSVPSVAVFHPG